MRIKYKVIYNDGSMEPVILVSTFKDLEHFEAVVQRNAEMDRQTEWIEEVKAA